MSDRERQEDEISVLKTIYTEEEFVSCEISKVKLLCMFTIQPVIDDKLTIKTNDGSELTIKHLPPITLYTYNPENYPSESPPDYRIKIPWLEHTEASKICEKLDELWRENLNFEILYTWADYLKNILSFLEIQNELKIPNSETTKKAVHKNVITEDYFTLEDIEKHNLKQCKKEFEQSYFKCNICFEENLGKDGFLCAKCNVATCKDCMKQYLRVKIKDEVVKSIKCTASECSAQLELHVIKDICPELYNYYDEQLLKATLNSMEDVIYCPRKMCSFPVIVDDDTLAHCSECNYNFCRWCKKGFHGVAPCELTESETDKLTTEYENASADTKLLLQKKYGRQQIQRLVENSLTKKYLKENTKSCPSCTTSIVKTTGCNKMKCSNCEACFCWLCGSEITAANGYSHFLQEGKCYGQLFRGIEEVEEFTFEEIIYNIRMLAMR